MKSLFFICIIFCIASSLQAQKKVVCYYGTWSVWRKGLGHFEVNDIDPTICSHIIYTFFGATPTGDVTYLDPYLDLPDSYGKDYIRKFIGLKNINPDVKLMAAVGGWNWGSEPFSQLAANEHTRNAFATNTLRFLLKWDFDGIDIDWEYPAQRGGNVHSDKANFVLMLKQLKETLEPFGKLVAIAAGATEKSASISYDIPNVVKYVDFVNLMAYDMQGSWNPTTGIHGALYGSTRDVTSEERTLNVDAAVHYWLSNGCPKEKLIMGIPSYGRTFTLASKNQTGIGALAIGPGLVGSFVPEQGFLPYNEICYIASSWTRFWDDEQEVPYAFKDNQWVGYDDIESVEIKLHYILANDLGGAMFWSVETDDFSNLCGHGRYPLISMAYSYMTGQIEPTAQPTTKKPLPPVLTTTTSQPEGFRCPQSNGLYHDPADNSMFYLCDSGVPHHHAVSVLFKN